ncbi:MAG: dihydroorotate dehydrogenase [Clostridia bacterium]
MNLKVNFCGIEFDNPVLTASGTFGFGFEYDQYYNISQLGGISVKGLTLKEREGNPTPRIAETYGGVLNSVGLQNPGVEAFKSFYLPKLKKEKTCKVIANIAGSTIDDYVEMARTLKDTETDLLEMNISCPNVKEGGAAFGTNAATIEKITSAVKKEAGQPLVVKLSPNVTDIAEMARAAEAGGADGISLINTLLGMRIDVRTRRPILANNVGGFSGPAVKPVAVRMVYQVANAVKLPIIGMGGIMNGEDAVEFMLAGASLVMVGTANFNDPFAALKVKDGIVKYMEKYNIDDVNSLVGAVIPN